MPGNGTVLGPLGTIDTPDFTDQFYGAALVLTSLAQFGRMPDYLVFEGTYTASGVDGGFELIVTRYGDLAVAPEFGVGIGDGFSATLRAGWVADDELPTREVLKQSLLGWAISGEISGANLALTVVSAVDVTEPSSLMHGPHFVEFGPATSNSWGASVDVSYGWSLGSVDVHW